VVLTVALAASVFAWAQPEGFAINSRGYDLDDSRVAALWRIDLQTGDSQYVGWTGRTGFIDVEGLAFDAQGRLFGADDSTNSLLRIGTSTGSGLAVASESGNMGIPLGQSMDFGMTFTCDGRLLVSSATQENLYWADPDTGLLTAIGNIGAPIVDLAAVGDRIFGIGLGTDDSGNRLAANLYEINPEAPSAEIIGPLGDAASPYIQAGLSVDDEGQLWAITDRNSVPPSLDRLPSEVLRIDSVTGEATKVAETLVGIESLAISASGGCSRGALTEPTAISTLSGPGQWLLALLLLMVAIVPLRRLAG
jgi:sugar lactone lactonase YvrE